VPQIEVIVDPELDGESDHSPVLLKVPYAAVFACSPPAAPPPMPRPEALCRPFPAALLTAWTDAVLAADGPTATSLAAWCERLHAAPGPVSSQDYDAAFAAIDNALTRVVTQAVDTFGTTAPVQPDASTEQQRTCFLPRTLGKQRKHHLKLLRLCRTVYQQVHAFSEGRINHDQLLDNNTVTAFALDTELSGTIGDMIFSLSDPAWPRLAQSRVLPRLKNLMKMHKINMKAVLRTHGKHIAQKQRKHLQTLYNKSRKQAHKVIFGASGNNTGVMHGGISAVQHPVRGLVTNPDQVRQAVDWHHRQ
jgi:hypothetical protein